MPRAARSEASMSEAQTDFTGERSHPALPGAGQALPRTPAVDRASQSPPRYELIELMFFAYRDFVEEADRVLADDGFGRAHHRVLYFVARRPGLTVAELLDILRITKQSLNRVLKDLLDRGYVRNRLGEADRRQRRLSATPQGEILIETIASLQSDRFTRAFAQLGPGAEQAATAFLTAMLDEGARTQARLANRAETVKISPQAGLD
jgi:DNA-binding MarR family transcriptional regulator